MMKKIRIGHIGTLHDHSESKLECVKSFPDIFEVVGYVPESEERYQEIKNKPAYRDVKVMTEEELFAAGVDAVLVEGFELELVNIARRCIDNNVHVHIDKPAGIDIAAFERLLRTAKQKNLVAQMAYMYRYNPALARAKEIIADGKLGDIYSVEAHMDCEHTKEKREWLGQFCSGMMFYLGCHLVDFMLQLQGIPEEIIPYNTATNIEGVTAEDVGFVIFKYKNGYSFAKTSAIEPGGFTRRQLVICGSEGTLEINPIERTTANGMECDMREVYRGEGWSSCGIKKNYKFEPCNRYDSMMLDFARFVRGEKKNPFTYEYELQLHKMVLKSCGLDTDYKTQITL